MAFQNQKQTAENAGVRPAHIFHAGTLRIFIFGFYSCVSPICRFADLPILFPLFLLVFHSYAVYIA